MTVAAPEAPPSAPAEGADELAVLLSIAVRIEPELLRAVRLVLCPHLGVDAEVELWFGRWIGTKAGGWAALRPDALPELRAELTRRFRTETAAAQRVWDVVSAVHANSSTALVLEEYLAWLSVQPDRADEIDGSLRPAVAAVVDEQRTGVLDWFTAAWKRLPGKGPDQPGGVAARPAHGRAPPERRPPRS